VWLTASRPTSSKTAAKPLVTARVVIHGDGAAAAPRSASLASRGISGWLSLMLLHSTRVDADDTCVWGDCKAPSVLRSW
jgi:hypothetical protein